MHTREHSSAAILTSFRLVSKQTHVRSYAAWFAVDKIVENLTKLQNSIQTSLLPAVNNYIYDNRS